jgi:hypothetical protein
MSQDQTQEQSAAGLNEPGSVLSAKEDDFDILKAGYEELSARYATLLNERDILKAELEKLQLAIKQLIRARYGRKSERVDPEQLQLALEGLEQDVGAVTAAQEQTEAQTRKTRRPPERNRGHLPAHLERYEVVIDIADKTCPCCGGALHVIDEDIAEQLDVIPLRLRVRVIRRKRRLPTTLSGGSSRARMARRFGQRRGWIRQPERLCGRCVRPSSSTAAGGRVDGL